VLLELERLVIGSCVESALYAVASDSYYLPSTQASSLPIFYEKLETVRKDFVWSRLQIILSLSGRLLNYENLKTVRVSEGTLKVASELGVFSYGFGVCEVFDTTGLQIENKIVKQVPPEYHVYDDFELSSLGGKHKYLQPHTSSLPLAGQIHYYTSNRVDGADYITDCVAKSTLSGEQLQNVEYSDSMTRFSVMRHLTSIGVHGNIMKRYKSGKLKYRKPKVVHRKRIVVKKERTQYEDSEKVKFLSTGLENIVDRFTT